MAGGPLGRDILFVFVGWLTEFCGRRLTPNGRSVFNLVCDSLQLGLAGDLCGVPEFDAHLISPVAFPWWTLVLETKFSQGRP